MKDAFSAFGSEVFRPLVTLLLPGALSISTWVTFVVLQCASVQTFANANRTEFAVLVVAVALFMGLLCEDLGSHIEEQFDRKRDHKDATHKANWHDYWRVAYRLEPIGHHYLRTVLLRLKFELGSCVACVIAARVNDFETPGIGIY
jgi:hypothetical protein